MAEAAAAAAGGSNSSRAPLSACAPGGGGIGAVPPVARVPAGLGPLGGCEPLQEAPDHAGKALLDHRKLRVVRGLHGAEHRGRDVLADLHLEALLGLEPGHALIGLSLGHEVGKEEVASRLQGLVHAAEEGLARGVAMAGLHVHYHICCKAKGRHGVAVAEGKAGNVRVRLVASLHGRRAGVHAEARPSQAAAGEAGHEAASAAAHLRDVAAFERHALEQVQVELEGRGVHGPDPGIVAEHALTACRQGVLLSVCPAVAPVHEVEAKVCAGREVVEECVPDGPLQVLEPLAEGLAQLLALATAEAQAAVAWHGAGEHVHCHFRTLYALQPLEGRLEVPGAEGVVRRQGGVVLAVVPAVDDDPQPLPDAVDPGRLGHMGCLVDGRDLSAPEAEDAPERGGEGAPEVAEAGGHGRQHQGRSEDAFAPTVLDKTLQLELRALVVQEELQDEVAQDALFAEVVVQEEVGEEATMSTSSVPPTAAVMVLMAPEALRAFLLRDDHPRESNHIQKRLCNATMAC
eukprot:CAMPEP_0204525770 /NCGR_PEP_ID=MMETSP0661-20131031/8078_1 /ASSEMBLY_ACC=CAM_ASM_000606 /TAXON_ID=109239 /ORGANISM="Alexandrium margalefi, Strain AMGDE01CS-322" /LENGTH=516 /DNA_ID=CAMNT_0051531577 /DNA_START=61 /DNA_END=1609 /DNA_ORIENTATION=-